MKIGTARPSPAQPHCTDSALAKSRSARSLRPAEESLHLLATSRVGDIRFDRAGAHGRDRVEWHRLRGRCARLREMDRCARPARAVPAAVSCRSRLSRHAAENAQVLQKWNSSPSSAMRGRRRVGRILHGGSASPCARFGYAAFDPRQSDRSGILRSCASPAEPLRAVDEVAVEAHRDDTQEQSSARRGRDPHAFDRITKPSSDSGCRLREGRRRSNSGNRCRTGARCWRCRSAAAHDPLNHIGRAPGRPDPDAARATPANGPDRPRFPAGRSRGFWLKLSPM